MRRARRAPAQEPSEPGATADERSFRSSTASASAPCSAASVAPVRMGFGTLVELVGEPGIGKSRLAQELRRTAQTCGRSDAALRAVRVVDAVLPVPSVPPLAARRASSTDGGEHNRAVLGERLAQASTRSSCRGRRCSRRRSTSRSSRHRRSTTSTRRSGAHGCTASWGRCSGSLLDSPTLLVFDDVHWMDDASSELLRYLGTQLPTRPWLACTTRRPGDGRLRGRDGNPPLPALTLRLEPLPTTTRRRSAVAAAGDRPPRPRKSSPRSWSAARATRSSSESSRASARRRTTPRSCPRRSRRSLRPGIDQLAPGDRRCFAGRRCSASRSRASLIADVLEDDPLVAAGSEAWDRLGEFVERDPDVPGAFRFRHALIRDAAYEGLRSGGGGRACMPA